MLIHHVLFLVVPILMIAMGICSLIWPRAIWWLFEGWKFEGAETSSFALAMTRVRGLLGIVMGTVFLVMVSR